MSKIIYLARPWTVLLQDNDSGRYISYPMRAFRTEAAAEQFAAENIPLSLNPCIACWLEVRFDDSGKEVFELSINLTGEYETPEKSHTVSLNDFQTLLQSLRLIPPEEISTEDLTDWWGENAAQMSDDQQRAIWRFLVPEPYQIIPVALDESEE